MLAWWTELLPVFIFRRIARRCGTLGWNGVAWHDARPDIAVRDRESWDSFRIETVRESCLKHGIEHAEILWGHFGKKILNAGIRSAFFRLPARQEGS